MWRQRIWSLDSKEPRSDQELLDTEVKTRHRAYFKAPASERQWLILIDQPDLLVVIYDFPLGPESEIWAYERRST